MLYAISYLVTIEHEQDGYKPVDMAHMKRNKEMEVFLSPESTEEIDRGFDVELSDSEEIQEQVSGASVMEGASQEKVLG